MIKKENNTDIKIEAGLDRPRVIVGAFIFNAQGELLLISSPKWKGEFVCPGGGIEYGENIEEALRREVKEEVNLDITDIKFLSAHDGIKVKGYKRGEHHLLFLDHRALAINPEKIKLDKEEGLEYKWMKPVDWLKQKNVGEATRRTINKYLVESDDYEGLYKRALADYQNLLKQSAKEKQEFVRYANQQLLHEIIPVYDNLKMSFKHFGDSGEKNSWLEGIGYIIKQFKSVLEGVGAEEIATEGKEFDHETMEAVGQEETDDEVLDGKVAKEVKAGYRLNGKVIEHARVIVYKKD